MSIDRLKCIWSHQVSLEVFSCISLQLYSMSDKSLCSFLELLLLLTSDVNPSTVASQSIILLANIERAPTIARHLAV